MARRPWQEKEVTTRRGRRLLVAHARWLVERMLEGESISMITHPPSRLPRTRFPDRKDEFLALKWAYRPDYTEDHGNKRLRSLCSSEAYQEALDRQIATELARMEAWMDTTLKELLDQNGASVEENVRHFIQLKDQLGTDSGKLQHARDLLKLSAAAEDAPELVPRDDQSTPPSGNQVNLLYRPEGTYRPPELPPTDGATDATYEDLDDGNDD